MVSGKWSLEVIMRISPVSCGAPAFTKGCKKCTNTTDKNTDYTIRATDVLPATAILGAGLLTVYFMKKGEIYNYSKLIK